MTFRSFRLGGPKPPLPADPAPLAALRRHWEALRPSGGLPCRGQIDPRALDGALTQSFLLQRIAPGLARFRIAGLALHDLTGMDLRGMPLSCLFDSASRTRLQPLLEQLFAGPALLTLDLALPQGLGRGERAARMILLPLADAQGQATLALGALSCAEGRSRLPATFSLRGAARERLPCAAPSCPPSPARFPHLRLVKG